MASKQVIRKVNKNWDLICGIGEYMRSKMYYKRGLGTSRPKMEVFFPAMVPGPRHRLQLRSVETRL
jgi:hypothetical protein